LAHIWAVIFNDKFGKENVDVFQP